jgi:putative hydrolases of HD superfamily
MKRFKSAISSMSKTTDRAIAKYIYESGILSKTPRSGLWFLGTGKQTVAEHTLRAVMISYALADATPAADKQRVVLMCLFHDIGEGRTSDLSYVHQRYGRLAEKQAIDDISRSIPFGKEVASLFNEFEERKTLEAKLVRDADQLEWVATLREEEEKGNIKARSWIKIALKRLKTPVGKRIGKMLVAIHPDAWWFNQNDQWFVDRKKKHQRWHKTARR